MRTFCTSSSRPCGPDARGEPAATALPALALWSAAAPHGPAPTRDHTVPEMSQKVITCQAAAVGPTPPAGPAIVLDSACGVNHDLAS